MLPRGTHEYSKFTKLSELAGAIRDAGLALQEIRGMSYNPVTRNAALNNTSLPPTLCMKKPA